MAYSKIQHNCKKISYFNQQMCSTFADDTTGELFNLLYFVDLQARDLVYKIIHIIIKKPLPFRVLLINRAHPFTLAKCECRQKQHSSIPDLALLNNAHHKVINELSQRLYDILVSTNACITRVCGVIFHNFPPHMSET